MTQLATNAHRSRWAGVVAWGLTLAAMIAALWLVLQLLNRCTPAALIEGAGDGAAKVVSSLKDALKPTITVSPVAVLRGEDKTPKLVVYTRMADVTAPISTEAWYGTSYSSATAKNCRAQFVIPLDELGDEDVEFIAGTPEKPGKILVLAPRPRLDTEMLVIAPETVEFKERSSGLYTVVRMFSGSDKEALTKLVRPALEKAMADRSVREQAEQAGREYFEKQFAGMLRSELKLGRDVVVDVRWVDD